MLAFKYISFHFLKFFFIILIALTMFMVGFDAIEASDKIGDSANLLLIYLVYKSFVAIDFLMPLSVVFAMITTKVLLIQSNALVSFYSLGYSKTDVLKPFLAIAMFLVAIHISLHSITGFSKAQEFSKNIIKNREYMNPTRDLFFTHDNKFIFFSKLIPLKNRAEGIRVFSMKESILQSVIITSHAEYIDNVWHIKRADEILKPKSFDFQISEGITVTSLKDIKILEGFRPKMLNQVYEGKLNYTISNALEAHTLLENEKLNTDIIKGVLYKIFVFPLFVPAMIVIIFFYVQASSRFMNVYFFSFVTIVSTLIAWGFMFMLIQLVNSSTILPEVGILLPILLLIMGATVNYHRYK